MGIFLQFISRRVPSKMTRIYRISVVIATIILGCFSGALWWIGRDFSLSRTLVLFPFYYTGLCCSKKMINRIKELRSTRKLLFAAIVFIIAFILGSWLMSFVPITFLHHAEGFKALNLSISSGVQARLICYIIAASLGLAILALTPGKELWFSKFGADTFPVYISHGLLMPANTFAPTSTPGTLLYFAVIIIGFIYLVYWIVNWGRNFKLKLHL
jgi:fucose 4-O-acetylase-like acetyltransferase